MELRKIPKQLEMIMLLKELEGQRKVLFGIIANFPSIFPSTLQEQGEYDSDDDEDEDIYIYI